MILPTLVQIAKGTATFISYSSQTLHYSLMWMREVPSHDGTQYEYHRFEFPIPLDDAGGGDFLREMAGLSILRWARKHVEMLREAENKATEETAKERRDALNGPGGYEDMLPG